MSRPPSTKTRQAEPDGTLVDDYDGPHPSMREREDILRRGLLGAAWNISSLISSEPRRQTTIKITKGGRSYTIEVFVCPNLAWSSGGRSIEEKRIQISNYTEHAAEFSLPKNGNHRCLLLGIYRRGGEEILCAWDAAAYQNHASPSSCYVKIQAIADAMRVGLGQSIDGKNRLVCCFRPNLLAYYVENMPELHERVVVNQLNVVSSPDDEPKSGSQQDCELELDVPNVLPPEMAHNRILYGAPGTGKSHRIDDNLNTYFPKPDHRQRITFHPDYTYTQFLGSYRPVPVYRNTEDVLLAADKETSVGNHEPLIDYQFVAGPFLRMLVRALTYPTHSFVLVIEELNRANAPAVFGEVFQLLDRGPDGTGKFSVELAPDARDYMRARGLSGRVQLPSNFYIWATMNSADQGVLPLDAAFKRRWSFEYMPLDENNAATESWKIALKFLHTPLNWNDFRKNINAYLASRGVAEDRLLGPFFMREEEMSNEDAFVNKILLYLREDVVRHNPELLFRGGVADLGYGALARSYQAGQNIFIDGISFGFTKGD